MSNQNMSRGGSVTSRISATTYLTESTGVLDPCPAAPPPETSPGGRPPAIWSSCSQGFARRADPAPQALARCGNALLGPGIDELAASLVEIEDLEGHGGAAALAAAVVVPLEFRLEAPDEAGDQQGVLHGREQPRHG